MSLAAEIAGVTVLADVIRPDGQGRPGGVDRPAAWLAAALRRQVGLAGNLPVDLLTPTALPELASWLAALRPPAAADALWAASHEALPPGWGGQLADMLRARLSGRFVVGYELPPWLRALLDAWALPYLDVRLHPVRFLDDLLFAVRASTAETQAALAGWAVAEALVHTTTGLREAMCRLIGEAALPAGTLLVAGQITHDASQIIDGTFFDATPHRARIAAICAAHRAVVLKPHPQDHGHSLLAACAGAANVLGVVNDNVYRLLALPEVTSVLTVNSSVAYEARYFGKTVFTLASLPLRLGWRGDRLDEATHASLDDTLLAPDFWRLVLAPHAPVTPMDGVRLPPKPNRLRIALDSFWNFNEIDTDRLPARAA